MIGNSSLYWPVEQSVKAIVTMLIRWAVVYVLFGVMLALAAMLAFEWHVIQEVDRERDTLKSKISALQGIAFERATNEEELAQARSANAAALNAADVARAELTHAQSALAAANRTIKEAHKELAVERQAREAAESSAQDAREQLAFEKARVPALPANHERTQQPPGDTEADSAHSVTTATTPAVSAPTRPSISTTARPKRVSTKIETPRRKKAPTLRALPQGRQALGQP